MPSFEKPHVQNGIGTPFRKSKKEKKSGRWDGQHNTATASDVPFPVPPDCSQDPQNESRDHQWQNFPSTADAPTDQPDSGINGIHPSRLFLFDTRETPEEQTSPLVMAPGPDQRSQHHHQPPHQPHHQQRSGSNGMSANGEPSQHQASTQRQKDQDKDQRPRHSNGAPPTPTGSGPMPSHIQVAKPYVFQQAIEGCLKDIGVAQTREDSMRLAGVQWIDNVRRALKLPVRTFDTAVIYYHKFRLVHADGEYSFVDAAAAALFAACKIEDTLKKSRDILCAAHNLKISNRSEHLSPDDSTFELTSRTIIGLERLMLESSSFDFRNRHPQHLLLKLAKFYGLPRSSPLVKTAYNVSIDMYRTFAPLKQCTATLAFACLELAGCLLNETDNHPGLQDIVEGRDYDRWNISRSEVMETLLDLLELYTHYRTSTLVGPDIPLDTFLEVRIPLNEELNAKRIPRFTEYVPTSELSKKADTGSYAATVNGVSAGTTAINGSKNSASPASPVTKPGQNGIRQKAGERGREGTVRFMLNPDRERKERAVVAEYNIPGPASAGVTNTPVPTGRR